MKNMKRAVRRHHVLRLQHTRRHYFRASWLTNTGKQNSIIVQYPAQCSCPMCGNPRKWLNERTIHELQDLDRYIDGMEELYEEQ